MRLALQTPRPLGLAPPCAFKLTVKVLQKYFSQINCLSKSLRHLHPRRNLIALPNEFAHLLLFRQQSIPCRPRVRLNLSPQQLQLKPHQAVLFSASPS